MKITLEQLKTITKAGIGSSFLKHPGPFSFAHFGGGYLGSPGKEIYLCLPTMSIDEKKEIAFLLASHYPSRPPGDDHVRWAACIREFYGIAPPGYLLSKNKTAGWELPDEFMQYLKNAFQELGCQYGMVIWHEMYAHRFGDRAIVEKDPHYLNGMIAHYNETKQIAVKIKSWKHTFTPFYWAAYYFEKVEDISNCVKYHKKTLHMMNKYCPNSRGGYKQKALSSYKKLKHLEPDEIKKIRKKITNKHLKKMLRLK